MQQTGLGTITTTDVEEELYLRGITIGIPVTPPPVVPPIPPPPAPDEPIVVVPPRGEIPPDPYLPIYPPPVVPPTITPPHEILPVIPGEVVPAGKGLGKAIIAILAVGVFAVMFLGEQEPEPKPRPRKRREPEPEPEPEEEYAEDYQEEEV